MQQNFSSQQALNKAMTEAVEFVHAEGWDAPPSLFALVPTQLLVDELTQLADDAAHSPLTLVVQELPEHIRPGSDELADCSRFVKTPIAATKSISTGLSK